MELGGADAAAAFAAAVSTDPLCGDRAAISAADAAARWISAVR